MPNWLVEGVIGHLVWWILFTAVGFVVAIARRKGWSWATPALYGLGAAALIFSIVLMGRAWNYMAPKETTTGINPENIESVIKQWSESFHYGFVREDDSGSYFKYVVTIGSGAPIVLRRLKDYDHYLSVEAPFTITSRIDQLPMEKQEDIASAIRIELLRYKIGVLNVENLNAPLKPNSPVGIQLFLPISNALTDIEFVRTLNELHEARLLVVEVIRSKLRSRDPSN